jgi:hypothetical protein
MPEIDDTTLTLLATGAVLAIASILIVYFRRSSRQRSEKLAPAFELGTTRMVGPFGTAMAGLYHGYNCRYTIEHASQYSPGGATLRLDASSPLQWAASKEDAGARLMIRMGILKDVQIGDQYLDQRLRFSGGDTPSLMGVFGQTGTRSAMRALVDTDNFSSVTVRNDRVLVKWTPRRVELDENPDVLRARLDAARGLLEACGYPPRLG